MSVSVGATGHPRETPFRVVTARLAVAGPPSGTSLCLPSKGE